MYAIDILAFLDILLSSMNIRRMSAKEARDNFADLLGTVYYGREPVIVEKQGRPYAVVINPEEYKRYRKAAKERFFELIDEIQTKNKDSNAERILQDVTAAVEDVRQENQAKSK